MSLLGYGSDGAHAPGRCSDRSKCMYGDTATESYIVAHNILNTHAIVVELYRNKYQKIQKGCIGIVLNQDWAEPWTSSSADIDAAIRRREFQLGWFGDPLFFGHYPASMIAAVGYRLPEFTEKQRQRLLHSIDFLGMNHYSTRYFSNLNLIVDEATSASSSLSTNNTIITTTISKHHNNNNYNNNTHNNNLINTIPTHNDKEMHALSNPNEMTTIQKGWSFDQRNVEHKSDPLGKLIGPQGKRHCCSSMLW